MHESVMNFVRRCVTPERVSGANILEIGSRNINGSVREIIEPMKPASYLGIDKNKGPGVDEVLDWADDCIDPDVMYDLVISTEMLEHCKDWRMAVYRMKYALRPGGDLILTTRSPGFPLHEEPDYWRFTLDTFKEIFADMMIYRLERDPQVPGVFIHATVTENCGTVDLDKINAIPVFK